MNLLCKKWTAILLVAAPFWANAQKTVELKAPAGKVQVKVVIGDNLTYSVLHEGDVMIEPSSISMKLTDGTVFGEKPRLKKKRYESEKQTLYPPVYKKKSIEDCYNQVTLDFRGGYSVIFRAYD